MRTRVVAIRHALPEDTDKYIDVDARPLSAKGKKNQQLMSQHLQKEGLIPDLILTSPILRAQQTAEIISQTFNVSYKYEKDLGNEFNGDSLLKKIPDPDKNQTIFLVGHAPTLAQFVHELVGKKVLPQGIPRSGAVVVDFVQKIEKSQGKFVKIYTPDSCGV
jgi:phosphohistidine phosphatase